MNYFIVTNAGQSPNTFSAQHIADLIIAGTLPSNVFVRDERRPNDWISASAVPEINSLHSVPPVDRVAQIAQNFVFTGPVVPGVAIGRLHYFMGLVGINLVTAALTFGSVIAMIAWGRHFGGLLADPTALHQAIDVLGEAEQIIALPVFLWLTSMRCRDLGMGGWHCLKMLIPFYNLGFLAELLSARGHSSTKR